MAEHDLQDELHVMKVVHFDAFNDHIQQLLMKAEHPLSYESGDYVMLGMNSGDLKPFSIANAPREDGLIECHIRIIDDNPWMAEFAKTQVGDTLVVQGPKKQMRLQTGHEPIIFVAGGTGFAPLYAILIESLRQKLEVPISFYWGARCEADLYMHDTMIELAQRHGHIEYIPVLSEHFDDWNGEKGLVHQTVLKHHPSLKHHRVYLCGSWPMIQTVKEDFIAAGLDADKLVF